MQVNVNTDEALQKAEQFTKDIVIPEITTQEHFTISSNSLGLIKDRLKELDTLRKSITKPLDEAKKNVMELFRPIQTKLTEYQLQLRNRIMTYNEEQEKIRQIEEERIQKEQERQAEILRKRAEKAKKPETVERLQEQAEQIESTPAVIVPPEKTEGLHFMKVWKYEIIDKSKVPDDFKMIDEVKIGKVIKATKGQMNIPGVKIYSEKVPVSK